MEAYILYIPAILAVIGLIYMMIKKSWVMKQDAGDGKMKTISDHIYEGALAFLGAEYRLLAIFVVIAAIALFAVSMVVDTTHWLIVPAFVFGAILSAYAGNIGMKIATKTNVRTTEAAKSSLPKALKIAFSGGTVMGLGVASLAVLGLTMVFIMMFHYFMGGAWTGGNISGVDGMTILLESLAGFSLGAESIALFARVGGGIYTKAADVGADLVGKVEAGIPEDDPRNPATIADNVGDNVGDVAGMGADLFGSYVATVLAAMVLGNYVIKDMGGSIDDAFGGIGPILLPMMIAGVGIIISLIGTMLVKIKSNDAKEAQVQGALNIGNWVSIGLVAVSCYFLCKYLLPSTIDMEFFKQGTQVIPWMNVFFATLVGLFVGGVISSVTEYYTGLGKKPILKIVEKSSTGAGTNIIAGLATGMISTFPSVILFAGAIWASYALAGFYGVALAASAMMATTAMQLAIDAFGPIADNAGGIAEMSELPEIVRERTDILDSVGNTTAATGKGFAIASAALTSLALFAAYVTFTGIEGINIFKAPVLAMLFVGGMIPVVFSALAMNAVGKAAMEMVYEVRRQFKEIPGIMEGTGKPEYDKCVAISTKASLKEMMLPGILTIGMPLLIAFGPMLFGLDPSLIAEMLGGYMAGVTVSGVLWAIFQNNAGGAWDNAKKSFEAGVEINGEMTYKGSDAHKAAVTGDTVGDPFKDTSGPSMNILIKLTCLIGLVIAPILGGHSAGNAHGDNGAHDSGIQADDTNKIAVAPAIDNGKAVRHELNTNSSEIIWTGSKVGEDHSGTLAYSKGWLTVFPNGNIKDGYFEIDMNSLSADMPEERDQEANLTGHLKSADFFEVDKYPTAAINVQSGQMKNGKITCKASVRIRDKSEMMKISGTYNEKGGEEIKMSANLKFDRTKFGIVYKSGSVAKALGDKMISDDIQLKNVMVFKK